MVLTDTFLKGYKRDDESASVIVYVDECFVGV